MALNSLEFYKDIFENMPEGILICDSNFRIIEINKAFESLSGISKAEIIGKQCSELISLDKTTCPVCMSKEDSAYMPEQYTHFADLLDKDSNIIPVRINHSTANDYYILNITALSAMVCLDHAHMDFVSTVSHELRTPLTSIKGFADTLLSAGDKLDTEKQRRFISIIKSQIDRLTRLVENLLTVSRLEGKKDKSIYKAIKFQEFIEHVIQNIQQKARDHIIETDILPNLPPIWADSDKLEQIMTNLIDNAVKYSNPKTTVTVKAGFAANNPDFIEIKVTDQGVGIPEEFLPKIFTKFSRMDNPLTRQVEGTGLGLYITKSLVESMGGRISADSDGKGSTFTVRLAQATPEKHTTEKFLESEK